jgi:hypothetical protein
MTDQRTMPSPSLEDMQSQLLALRHKILQGAVRANMTELPPEATRALQEIDALLMGGQGQSQGQGNMLAEGLQQRGQLARLRMMKKQNGTGV